MNFTREPIIETIISPKEGYKLLVRSSRGGADAEEFFVDAVEVVSFGRGFFFRSLERPKAFLLPISDYEILEVKETRVALKNVSHERNIKIGGGREAPMRHPHRESSPDKEHEPLIAEEGRHAEETPLEAAVGSRMEKRRDRRRRRHRRSDEQHDWNERREPQEQQVEEGAKESTSTEEEAKVSTPMFSSLIPPPSKLISDTISRYKDKEFMEGYTKNSEEKNEEKKDSPAEEDPSGAESSPLNRVASGSSENLDANAFSATFFSPLQSNSDSFLF